MIYRAIFVALAMGLAWANRGHFGHEHGAAWAGAIGGAAILAMFNRRDWQNRLPVVVALAALGWAVGGMMSYGRIVGYGRADDFMNVFYGFTMLAVVGGLYGFMGGGFLGLGLETTREKRPHWPSLIAEMTVGAILFWSVLIFQFEWKMTPPRSELWAACLGASVALAWYCWRNGFHRSFTVAMTSALGAGFGFALGNFFQVMGNVSGIAFNWWNVMEFTLGSLGGLGMVWGISLYTWPQAAEPKKGALNLGLMFVLLVIPITNLIQAFDGETIARLAADCNSPNACATAILIAAWGSIVLFAIIIWKYWQSSASMARKSALTVFLLTIWYTIFSHIRMGFADLASHFQLRMILYWLVIALMALIYVRHDKQEIKPVDETIEPLAAKGWIVAWLIIIVIIAGLALIAISMHSGLPGAQSRFGG